jgi:regulator of RNase E activity RraA
VLVCPGDIVIGDADGVIVVPRAQVARFAREILAKDKFARQQLYKSIGMPSDRTVE